MLIDDLEEQPPMSTAFPSPSGVPQPGPVSGAPGPRLQPLATQRTRMAAGAVTATFSALVVGVGLIIGGLSSGSGAFGAELSSMVGPGLVAAVIWLLMVFGLLAGSSASPGQWVLGVETVDAVTGEPSGRRAIVKEAWLIGLGIITLGIAPLVLMSRSNAAGQNRFDLLAGTQVVQRRGHGVPDEGAGFLSGLLHTQASPRLEAPEPAPREVAAAAEQPLRVQVLLDQGTRLPLDRAWVLGRNPEAQAGAQPFLVPDLGKTLSKSHVVVSPAPGGASVTDLHSTNGVQVRWPNGATHVLAAGETVSVPVGSTITWGARTMEIQTC